MKVHGFEVTPEIERACLAAMVGIFSALDIANAAVDAGAEAMIQNGYGHWLYHANRIADRLIQRERKAGRIKRVGNRWERV